MINRNKMWRFFLPLMLMSVGVAAQEVVTLEDAINKALEHNFDIRIAKTDADVAAANNTLGNAGILPNIDLNGGVTAGSQTTRIEFADGRVQQVPNAASVGYNGSVSIDWTLFDGGKMFLVKNQLNEYENAARAQLKQQVQSVISQVIQAYANVVLQQQQGVAIDTGLVLARTRMDLSKVKYETGSSAKVDYLQARVDYNARQSDSLAQEASLTSSYANLNVLMGQEADELYEVQQELDLNAGLQPKNKELLEQVNPMLEVARINVNIAELDKKIAKTTFLPLIQLNAAYGYNETQSQAGFALFNRSYGPSGGLNLTLPLYRGGNVRRQAKVASLQSLRAELLYDQQNTELGRMYRVAWRNYEVSVSAYNLETENIKYAKENLNIQRERFKVGIANTLETREAENSYVQALVRLYTAAYQLKIDETKVLEIEGALIN